MIRSPWITRLGQPRKYPYRKQYGTPRGERFRPFLEALEDRTLLSATTYLVNLAGDAGTGSGTVGDLRYCINQADNPANAGSTITFDTTALGSKTITLTKGQLAIADNMTITGPGVSNLTLSGSDSSRVFNITAKTAQVTISGLTIAGGSAAYGGGIYSRGSLTVSDSILSGNSAAISGGGICNDGTLIVSNSTLTDNSAPACGGGGISNNGSLTLSGSTVSDNTGYRGSGVLNSGAGTLTVKGSTLSGNTATYAGGLWSNGVVTVSGSTLSGNSATSGGGIYNIGNLTVSNSTLCDNSAQYVGGLHNTSGTATLTNVTLADNIASISVGGIDAFAGAVLLHNTLVAGNVLKNSSVNKPFDVAYSLDSASDYNLIGDGRGSLSTANHNLLGSVAKPLNPLLAALGDYGGTTQTLALLPGSPALDAGSSAYGGSTDQRGQSRVGNTDIGAFESQGFTLAVSSGNNQSAIVTNVFADPLVVTVIANNPVEPVSGAVITFTAPASSASAILSSSTATTGSDGKASITATATTYMGTYTVSASTPGITSPANFSLSNTTPGSLVVTALSDETNPIGTNSLREAIAYADTLSGPHTITFDPSILTKQSGNVIDLQSALPDLKGNITVKGPGANVLTVQRDASAAAFRVFTVDAGATAAISGLTISGGSTSANGGGISNAGSLSVSVCTLSGNSTGAYGGGIYNNNTASLTVSGSTLSGNSASEGGGILNNYASLTVSNSTLSGNTADIGGGIESPYGNLTVSNSTLSGNSATAGDGGGLIASGNLTVSNSTLSGNSANYEGGGISLVYVDALLHNTLIAGNLAAGNPSDVNGGLDSASDYNLISDGSGGLSTANHNLLGTSANPLNPLLAPLGNYGGPTQTMALLPGNPAIDAGSSAYGGSTDQRGKPRVGATDIGAFESQGFTLAVSSGNNQSAEVTTAFANPLVVSLTANNSVEPVAGGAITFTAPTSGASAVFNGSPATIGDNDKASVTATANGKTGTYSVSASATGIANPANFSLTNTYTGPASLVVTTLLDQGNPSGTNSLREAILYADTLSGPHAITFDPSILTKQSGNVIDLLTALPELTGNVTIEGPGANVLTVQRDAKDAQFGVFTVDAGATAAISGLTISGGSAVYGGGINNNGSLTVSDSTLSGNSAAGNVAYQGGGGIYNSGSLTVSDCTLSDNSSPYYGGGIDNTGSLTVSDTTLSGNTSSINGGVLYNGGRLDNQKVVYGTATVSASTLSGNTAGYIGGGIDNEGGTMTISGCTLSANSASNGGGISITTGTITVSDSTLSANSASNGGGIIEGVLGYQGDVLLHNTLIAGNQGGDLGGSFNSASDYNLISDGSGGLTSANHNLLGVNPQLAPLGNYGGQTKTIALLPGSPAIDAGSSAYGGSTDQRGKPRFGATDIGAFESQGFTLAISSGNNQSAAGGTAFANPLVVTVKANNAVEPVAGGAITFTAPSSGASATFSANPATIDSNGKASVTATAHGDAGSYTVSASATGIASPAKFSLTNSTAQTTYDAVSDFSNVANPNDVWNYLYELNGSAPQLMDNRGNPPTGFISWWDGYGMPDSVYMNKNTTGSTITDGTIVSPPNLLWVDPESGTAIVRWTAPSTGTWNISGLFQGIDTNTQDHPVEILENSSTVLLSATSLTSFGQQVPFSDKVTLNKGDTIDFIVLTGPTTFAFLSTGLSATISKSV